MYLVIYKTSISHVVVLLLLFLLLMLLLMMLSLSLLARFGSITPNLSRIGKQKRYTVSARRVDGLSNFKSLFLSCSCVVIVVFVIAFVVDDDEFLSLSLCLSLSNRTP